MSPVWARCIHVRHHSVTACIASVMSLDPRPAPGGGSGPLPPERARRLLEVAAAEIGAAETPATTGGRAAEVSAGGSAVGEVEVWRECPSEQEPGEQAGSKAVAAPVRRGEAGVDVVDRGAVSLHPAHVGFYALFELVRAGGADGDVAARLA